LILCLNPVFGILRIFFATTQLKGPSVLWIIGLSKTPDMNQYQDPFLRERFE